MLKKMILVFLLVAAGTPATLRAQGSVSKEELQKLKLMEDSLLVTADSMYSELPLIPEERNELLKKFVRQLKTALQVNNSWQYGFDTLGTRINIVYPEDKSFRIFNWAMAPTPVTRRYYGALQMPSDKLKLYPLVDYSQEMTKGAEDSVLTGSKWMGCLYYRIIDKEVDGHKVYTLFGLNASSAISNKKLLDALTLTEEGPVFGAPIFGIRSQNFPSRRVNRFIMEYKKDVQVSMNWDEEQKAIYFDRLVSQVNDPNRKYTYVPSGAYDGFRWDGAEWKLVEDLIPVELRKDGDAPISESRPPSRVQDK